jgi:hypothetical protein
LYFVQHITGSNNAAREPTQPHLESKLNGSFEKVLGKVKWVLKKYVAAQGEWPLKLKLLTLRQ